MIPLLLATFWIGYIWACAAKESDGPGSEEETILGIAVAISIVLLLCYGVWAVNQ